MNREGEVEDEGEEGTGTVPETAGRAGTQDRSGEIEGTPIKQEATQRGRYM